MPASENFDSHVNLRRRVREGYRLEDAREIAYNDYHVQVLRFGDVDPFKDWEPEKRGGWRGD
jgi:hypothetical protein